jgi:hypothetical protein
MRVYAKHCVRQRQNNLTTFFNFNERKIIRPNIHRNKPISNLSNYHSDRLPNDHNEKQFVLTLDW